MEYRNNISTDTLLSEKLWGGACDTVEYAKEHGVFDELCELVEEVFEFGETPTLTQINDFVWFDADYIYERLGISEKSEESED
jgi:hypothetical protein